ncbi:DUF2782 domain-containing protein [Arenimonas caeni]|nr:DUF2782 domain-containing protein [Arenimonas caeni]
MNMLIPLLFALAAQDAGQAAEPVARDDVPIPEKVQAPVDDPPAVSIRTEANGDRVEEYRQNGVLYMVKVTPERGPSYYLIDTDGNGRLNRDGIADGVADTVSPVYWSLYEWD